MPEMWEILMRLASTSWWSAYMVRGLGGGGVVGGYGCEGAADEEGEGTHRLCR